LVRHDERRGGEKIMKSLQKLPITNLPSIVNFKPGQVDPIIVEEIRQFLDYEAMLLDDYQLLWDWCNLLAEDFHYKIPVRIARERHSGQPLFSEKSVHMEEYKPVIKLRLERLETEHAWAEEPPSRLRRVLSGVLVGPGKDENHFKVRSSFILYRGRDRVNGDIVAGQRHDILRKENGGYLLVERIVYLDHVVIPTGNLSFFF
jgi:3-phenylpropionate/cinnamic acid dioxygenase small subunit